MSQDAEKKKQEKRIESVIMRCGEDRNMGRGVDVAWRYVVTIVRALRKRQSWDVLVLIAGS
jgi:hypothetical protein